MQERTLLREEVRSLMLAIEVHEARLEERDVKYLNSVKKRLEDNDWFCSPRVVQTVENIYDRLNDRSVGKARAKRKDPPEWLKALTNPNSANENTCVRCNGTGIFSSYDGSKQVLCKHCGGRGYVRREA